MEGFRVLHPTTCVERIFLSAQNKLAFAVTTLVQNLSRCVTLTVADIKIKKKPMQQVRWED